MANMPVAAPAAQAVPDASPAAAQGWPRPAAAYFALAVLVLATFLNFLDATAFGLMIERIKADFALSDEQLGWLLGPANIIFYVLVGIPLARLVDVHPRKLVLAGGLFFITIFNAAGGLAQGFAQLFASRVLIGAGGSAHAPGAYSMLADFFPPRRLPRAIAVLQLGYIGGTTIGLFVAGQLLAMVGGWGAHPSAGAHHPRLAMGAADPVGPRAAGRRDAADDPGAAAPRPRPRGQGDAGRHGRPRDLAAQARLPAPVHRAGVQRDRIAGAARVARALPDAQLRAGPRRRSATGRRRCS
ncbi:MAG: MFS transporter [Sphingomonas sp.]